MRLKRAIRQNRFVERSQQLIRKSPTLHLEPINLQIDVAESDILIDCGANVGDMTSKFARTGARVYAFEPSPICFEILRRRFSLSPNVTILNKGVMDQDCRLDLSTPTAHGGFDQVDSTVAASFVNDNLPESSISSIECIDLGKSIESIGKVRLLKLDIEGAEIQVLNGLLDTKAIDLIDLIVAETHEDQIPSLAEQTEDVRARIAASPYASRVRLDWI